MRNHLTSSPATVAVRRRPARLARLAAVVAATTIGALALGAREGSASDGELAVNALAPEITEAAGVAVDAYDSYMETGEYLDFMAYARHRTETARLVARQLGYAEYDMAEAWAATSLPHQRAVLAAMTQIGVPYRTNASAEGEGFDCSGLTLYAWDQAGLRLNRVSGDQINAAEKVGRDGAAAGDLVYYPGHIMMYLGVDDAIVHSISTGRTVEIDTISERRADSARFADPTG